MGFVKAVLKLLGIMPKGRPTPPMRPPAPPIDVTNRHPSTVRGTETPKPKPVKPATYTTSMTPTPTYSTSSPHTGYTQAQIEKTRREEAEAEERRRQAIHLDAASYMPAMSTYHPPSPVLHPTPTPSACSSPSPDYTTPSYDGGSSDSGSSGGCD